MGYIGDFQSRVILTAFYFLVVPVFALLVRVNRRRATVTSRPAWVSRPTDAGTLDAARRQS